MKVLTPSRLIRISVGLGVLEIIIPGSGYLYNIPSFYLFGKYTEWQLAMKLEQCEGKYPTTVLLFSQIYFLFVQCPVIDGFLLGQKNLFEALINE